jgi:hypothetical protein
LVGGPAIPLHCLGVVLRNAQTVLVEGPQVALGSGIALDGCFAPSLQRCGEIATTIRCVPGACISDRVALWQIAVPTALIIRL